MKLAYRYDAIVDECMALAAVYRKRLEETISDKGFHADQHRRAILRAARFARLAESARSTAQGIEAATAGVTEGLDGDRESPVGNADAPETPSIPTTQGNTP